MDLAFQKEASFNSTFTLKDILLDLRYFGDRRTVWREQMNFIEKINNVLMISDTFILYDIL